MMANMEKTMNQTTNNPTTTQQKPTHHVIPTLTEQQFIDMMLNLKAGNNFVTIITRTVPDMNKTGNPFYDATAKDFTVRKVSEVNGMIQFDYEAGVNRQRDREGKETDFVAVAPTWGVRVGDSCIIEHKGKHYFYIRVQKSLGHKYIDLAGNALDSGEVEKWLRPHKSNERQELDKEIIVRKYCLSNIIAITLNGTRYVILH